METPHPEQRVRIAPQRLAEVLGVTPSALSHAVRKRQRVRGFTIADWPALDASGRVEWYDIPASVADEVLGFAGRESVQWGPGGGRGSTMSFVGAQPPADELGWGPQLSHGPRSDSDYQRQMQLFKLMIDRSDADADRSRQEASRLRDALEESRANSRREMDEHRARADVERDRHLDERQALRDELASARAQIQTLQAGLPVEDATEPLGFLGQVGVQLATRHGGELMGLAQSLVASLGRVAGEGVNGQVELPLAPELQHEVGLSPLITEPVEPSGQEVLAHPDDPVLEPDVQRMVDGLLDNVRRGNLNGVLDAAEALRRNPGKSGWSSIASALVIPLMGADPDGTIIASWVRPVLTVVYPAALSLDAGMAAKLASGFFSTDPEAGWVHRVVRAGLRVGATPAGSNG